MEKCQFCGRPASVHVTQIINNKASVVRMCDECAAEKGLLYKEGLPFSMLASVGEALMAGLKQHSALNGLICSKCGCTPMSFKETGRLGCMTCYKDLQVLVDSIIETSQKGMQHKGKKPHCYTMTEVEKAKIVKEGANISANKRKKMSASEKLEDLQNRLEVAIKEERYEDAAQLRDEIKNLKESQKG